MEFGGRIVAGILVKFRLLNQAIFSNSVRNTQKRLGQRYLMPTGKVLRSLWVVTA